MAVSEPTITAVSMFSGKKAQKTAAGQTSYMGLSIT
jgi:hypothetical protein